MEAYAPYQKSGTTRDGDVEAQGINERVEDLAPGAMNGNCARDGTMAEDTNQTSYYNVLRVEINYHVQAPIETS